MDVFKIGHITTELVILAGLSYYFNNQISSMKEQISKLESTIQKHENFLNQIYYRQQMSPKITTNNEKQIIKQQKEVLPPPHTIGPTKVLPSIVEDEDDKELEKELEKIENDVGDKNEFKQEDNNITFILPPQEENNETSKIVPIDNVPEKKSRAKKKGTV